jgi:hypothetical protein
VVDQLKGLENELAFCNCRKKSQNGRRGSCVIAPCIGGRVGRGRDGPVQPQ